MLYNSNDKTIDLAKELEKKFNGNSRVIALKCPVDDPKAVAEVTQKVVDEFGRIDVYVGASSRLSRERADRSDLAAVITGSKRWNGCIRPSYRNDR